MLHDEKPQLDENLLEHHGIKGMKWGVRNRRSYPSAQEIHRARASVEKDRNKVAKQRVKAVKATVKRAPNAPNQRAKLKDMKVAALKNPDRVTAMKLTKGESAVQAVLFAAHPAMAVGVTASLAAREATARTVQRRQARGAYDTKR